MILSGMTRERTHGTHKGAIMDPRKSHLNNLRKLNFQVVEIGKVETPLMKIRIARIMRRKDHQGDVTIVVENIT